jgi:hypothetical protein
MTVNVDPIPPVPEPPPGGDAPGSSGTGPGAPIEGTALASEWTEADLKALLEIIRGPYDKIAEVTADPAYTLSKIDELVLVGTLTTWMPVSWVRSSSHGRLPLLPGLLLTAGALILVNLPRLLRWNITHPDQRIPIPFIKEARHVGPRPTPQPSRPDRAGADAADRAVDHEGAPAQEPSADPDPSGAVDGGPPADSLDSIRGAYRH